MHVAPLKRNGHRKRTAPWWPRVKVGWPILVWLAAIAIAALLFLRSGQTSMLTGVVDTLHEEVAPLETARLKTLHVKEGQQIRKEHILAELDSSILEAEMELNQQRAGVTGEVKDAHQRLLQLRLDGYSLRALRDGTVSRVFKQPGEIVAAGEPVLQLVAAGNGRIVGFLPERQAHDVSVGDEGYVISPSSASRRIRATVAAVGPDIVTDPGRASLIRGQPVRGRRLILTLEENHGLIPGETVLIRLSR